MAVARAMLDTAPVIKVNYFLRIRGLIDYLTDGKVYFCLFH